MREVRARFAGRRAKGMAVSGEAEQKTQAACPRRRTTPTRARSHCPPSLCAGSGPMGALSFQPPQCSGGPRLASQEDKLRIVTRQGHLVGPRQSQGGNYVPDQLSQRAHLAQCRRFSKSAACLGVSLIPIALCWSGREPTCTSEIAMLASPPAARASSLKGNRLRHASVDDDTREQDNNGFLWGFPFLGSRGAGRASPTAREGARILARADPPPGGKPAGLEVKGTSERRDVSPPHCVSG